MVFTTTREIDGKQYEGVIETFPGETDVFNVYVLGPDTNERGERTYWFTTGEGDVVSEERESAPIGGTYAYSNNDTSDALDGLFESI